MIRRQHNGARLRLVRIQPATGAVASPGDIQRALANARRRGFGVVSHQRAGRRLAGVGAALVVGAGLLAWLGVGR